MLLPMHKSKSDIVYSIVPLCEIELYEEHNYMRKNMELQSGAFLRRKKKRKPWMKRNNTLA